MWRLTMFRLGGGRSGAVAAVLLLAGCGGSGTVSSIETSSVGFGSTSTSSVGSGSTSTPQTLSVTLSPQSLVMKHCDSWQFAAAVNSTHNLVSWSIQEGSTGGAVSDAGLYTSPATDG